MKIDFQKCDGLVPAIIQDVETGQVLMLGYMNEEAFHLTKEKGQVTFFSRSRNALWTKGETSGNYLKPLQIAVDCDGDTLLIKARPVGPVCHTGTYTCWGEEKAFQGRASFLSKLEDIIDARLKAGSADSYTVKLSRKGVHKVAQKVGEEAVETVIEALRDNRDLLLEETADLMYHLILLLKMKEAGLADVANVLEKRHSK